MPEIDSLEIRISASMEKASASIDLLTRKLGVLAQGIQAIGSNKGIDEFIQKSQSLSAEIEHMGKRVSDSMKPIQEQAKKQPKMLNSLFLNSKISSKTWEKVFHLPEQRNRCAESLTSFSIR